MPDEANNYVLRTRLTATQVAEALNSSMDPSELDFIFRVNVAGFRPIIGNADEDQCQLMRRPRFFSSDYAGIFSANIRRENDCTRLDGQFVKVFFGFPGGSRNSRIGGTVRIIIGILILLTFELYNVARSLLETDHRLVNPPAVFAGVLLIFLCISYSIAVRAQRRQREFVLNHVKQILHASETVLGESH